MLKSTVERLPFVSRLRFTPCAWQGKLSLWISLPFGLSVTLILLFAALLFVARDDSTMSSLGLQLLLGTALASAVFNLYIFVRRMRPLQSSLLDLEEALRAFMRGYYSRTLPETGPNELMPIAAAVNSLGARLDRSFRELLARCEQQRSTLANMKEGLLVIDHEYRVLTVNNSGARLLDCDVEMLQGRDIRSFGPVGEAIGAAPAGGEEVELPLQSRAGERWLRARVTKLCDAAKRPLGSIIELTEITDIKRFTQARQDFVANVSHELKTPITSIQGYVETLLDGDPPAAEDRERFLKIVAEQADRLSTIVSELLSLVRLESEQRLDPETLLEASIFDVLTSACESCAVAARKRNINIRLDCERDLRWRLNRWLIEQALINLLDNSAKYAHPDSEVQVIARTESRWLVISVLDESAGIAAEHLPRLFERFYRVDKARSRKVGGSGLGLAIVKHIAAVHGGKVLVESEEGKGSSFSLILPAG